MSAKEHGIEEEHEMEEEECDQNQNEWSCQSLSENEDEDDYPEEEVEEESKQVSWQTEEEDLVMRQLKEILAGLTCREFTLRVQAAKDFRRLLRGDTFFAAKLLQQYVQCSSGCIELLEAWKLGIEGKNSVPIFALVSDILKHPAGKYVRHDVEGEKYKVVMYVSMRLDKFARTIVRTKMKDVYSEMDSRDRKRQKAALFLMAAIVRRGKATASEVAASFDFTLKAFPKLSHADVARPGFIEFAMAFLEVSSPSLLRWVLQIRPLYAGLLRGLGKDDEETIVNVLNIIQEKVLGATSLVPSGLRSVLFGDAVLEQLSAISADLSLGRARDIAHETLVMLCTDPSHGLVPKYSLSKTNEKLQRGRGNLARLLRLMLKLRSTEVDNHKNLLLAMVRNMPSLVSAYLDSFPYSLEPRASSSWFAAISLVSDLIHAANICPLFSLVSAEWFSPPSLEHPVLHSRLKCILPRSFGRAVINRGLLHTNIFVKHASLRVLWEALNSLECLLRTTNAAVEDIPKKVSATEMQTENLSKCISDSYLFEVNGLSGIGILRALCSFGRGAENIVNHSSSIVESSKQKWIMLNQEIQNEIRGLLPDPQVLLSLLSSLKSENVEKSTKRNFSSIDSHESEKKVKSKKRKSISVEHGVEIFVSGIKVEERNDITEESVNLYPDQGHQLDTIDEYSATIAQIWGMSDENMDKGDCKGLESMLYTKVLDVLSLYQRTLPIVMIECSFDAFKLLPEEPLLLSTCQQQSILSLLVEYTGGLHLSASAYDGHGLGTGQIHKYLRPLLNLMLYSPLKDVRRYAHLLAYRLMLSTGAFERNKGEIEVWFSFLPIKNGAEVIIKESQEIHMQDGSTANMFSGLVSTVMEFLCDAVSAVGKNLFKFLDESHCVLSKHSSTEDIAAPQFSPLVICVLEKCLRVVGSSSKHLKLPQRTMISVYVASVMNFLLQSQADSRTLALIIVATLCTKSQQLCQHDQASEHFLCEWSPLRDLLLSAQSVLCRKHDVSSLEFIHNQLLSKGSISLPRSLSQVLSILENTDCDQPFGAASAFAASMVCSMPEEIVENFSSIVAILHDVFRKDYSILLALFCAHKELFGRIAEVWADAFSLGMDVACNQDTGKRDKNNSQVYRVGWQHSSVNYGFKFSNIRFQIAEQQLPSVTMNGMCSKEPLAVAFASFIQSIPFSNLFMLCANSYQSKLLAYTSIKVILEAKLPEVSYDYTHSLQIILYWILQIESSWSEGLDLTEQFATCFSLLIDLLVNVLEVSCSDNWMNRLDVGFDMTNIEDLFQAVLVHPAINMFMCKSKCSSVHKDTQNLEVCEKSTDLHYKKWKIACNITSLEIFLHLCQEKVHPIDNSIIHMLMTLLEFVSSQCKRNQDHFMKYRDLFYKGIVLPSKTLILRSLSVFKNELAESVKAETYEICPLSSFFILSVLSPFISPFNLLELVHWLFSNDIYEHNRKTIAVLGSNISFLDVGLYFGAVAFEMFSAYLNQTKGDACIQLLFWDMEGQKFDANLVQEVYVKMIEASIKWKSEIAERCLLSITKALQVQTGTIIPPRLLPMGIMLSHLASITPPELIKHCIYNTNQLKAKILLLLTKISTLHLTICGELITANMDTDLTARHLVHLDSALMVDNTFLEINDGSRLSENELLILLPVAVRCLFSDLSISRSSLLKSSERISAYYFSILWNGFMKWDVYTCCKVFDIDYDEGSCMNIEDYESLFKDSLLGQAVCMVTSFPTLEKLTKKRKKLFTSILPKITCPLDHCIDRASGISFKQLLNMVNRVLAKASLARWLLFLTSGCLSLHVQSNSDGQPGNSAPKYGPDKVAEFDAHELKMETAEYGRFINCLICTLDAIFQYVSIQSSKSDVTENRNRANVSNYMERTILTHLVEVCKEVGAQSLKAQYIPSLKVFTRSTFLHRFENCMVLKTIRCLLLVLSQEDHVFAEDALGFLIAHSQFVSTILSTSFRSSQCLGQSDKGTMFRYLTGILNLLPLPSFEPHNAIKSEDVNISSHVHKLERVEDLVFEEEDLFPLKQRKLEVVKLLRLLYHLRVQGFLNTSIESSINTKELFSLLLAGYGATMNECDLEIFSLMHEIESFSGPEFCGLSGMNYLWGEAALKRRRQQQHEKLLSEYSYVDEETTEECQKRDFRENLLIDPKVCGETILFFPFERSTWDGPTEITKFTEKSLKEINLETKERPSLNSSSVVCYDPAYILEFSIHALSVGYIESVEFARLGLLGLAFASLSSVDESMRKLAYSVLGRYTKNLEDGQNFKGRPQLLLLLSHVKNAIVEPWQKIPSVSAIFAAEASCIMMDPTNNLYPTLNKLLMRAPAMVLESIPLFHSMFGSGSVHYQNDQMWILRLVAAGLNLNDDSQIYRQKFVLELLMSFYDSPLPESQTKLLVLQVLKKAVKRRPLAQFLVEHAGLLLWLSSAVMKCTASTSDKSAMCFLSIILEMIHDLLSWRSITKWLLANGFEQLSETAYCLHCFLVSNTSLSRQQEAFIKYALHVLASIISLSRQRKLYQTHFCLSFEGLFQVSQFIEHRDPDMTSRDIVKLGLKIILASSPPAVVTVKDKLRLLKLGMWSISGTLQTHSLSSFEEKYADKRWIPLKAQQFQEDLMEKLLRWLVASIILGKVYGTANQEEAYSPSDKPNLEKLLSLMNYLKGSCCLSEMEHNLEVNKALAQLILYLYQLVGMHCRILPSVVAAVSFLLLPDNMNFIDGTFCDNKLSSLLALLLSEVSSPAEVNLSWRWSFNSPWKHLSSKISDVQILWENEVCQVLLRCFDNLISGRTPNFNFISSTQKMVLSDNLPVMRNKLAALKAEICKYLSGVQNIEVSDKFVSPRRFCSILKSPQLSS